MGPPDNPDLAPLDQQRRVMPLLLGNSADPVGKGQSIDEILKPEGTLKPPDHIVLGDAPIRKLFEKDGDFLLSCLRCPYAAYLAFHLCEFIHGSVLISNQEKRGLVFSHRSQF